jgi:hypothetical protein
MDTKQIYHIYPHSPFPCAHPLPLTPTPKKGLDQWCFTWLTWDEPTGQYLTINAGLINVGSLLLFPDVSFPDVSFLETWQVD